MTTLAPSRAQQEPATKIPIRRRLWLMHLGAPCEWWCHSYYLVTLCAPETSHYGAYLFIQQKQTQTSHKVQFKKKIKPIPPVTEITSRKHQRQSHGRGNARSRTSNAGCHEPTQPPPHTHTHVRARFCSHRQQKPPSHWLLRLSRLSKQRTYTQGWVNCLCLHRVHAQATTHAFDQSQGRLAAGSHGGGKQAVACVGVLGVAVGGWLLYRATWWLSGMVRAELPRYMSVSRLFCMATVKGIPYLCERCGLGKVVRAFGWHGGVSKPANGQSPNSISLHYSPRSITASVILI